MDGWVLPVEVQRNVARRNENWELRIENDERQPAHPLLKIRATRRTDFNHRPARLITAERDGYIPAKRHGNVAVRRKDNGDIGGTTTFRYDPPDTKIFSHGPQLMSTFAVIIPAAGQSSRFVGFEQKKPFIELLGIPVWQRTVDHFVALESVVEIVLVLASEDRASFETKFQAEIASRNIIIVSGGDSRAASVQNGIQALASKAEYIAVHDAARPLLTESGLQELFSAAEKYGSVIPGIPVTSTVKRISSDNAITETVDRQPLRLAQTPQVFRRSILQQAFSAATDLSVFTDEASLVEAMGTKVFVHPGWPQNIKITTADDFRLAQMLLQVKVKK